MARTKKKSTPKKTAAKRGALPRRPARAPAKAKPRSTRPKTNAPRRPRDGRPAMDWPALAPYMTVRDGQASVEFYARAFGFETYGDVLRDEDGHVQHAGMRLGDAAIMFGPEEGSMGLRQRAPDTPDSLSLYVYVPDVDRLCERAQRAGAKVVQPPTDQFWADRTAVLKDADGYHWTFATHLGKR